MMQLIGAVLALALTMVAGRAQPAPAPSGPGPRHSVWNGYDRIDFTLSNRACVLVVPKEPAPGRPWIWRAEVFDLQPQVDLALLQQGWHVAYIDTKNMYGSRRAVALFGEFYAHVVTQARLAPRVVLEAYERGALTAFNFAATHPSRVAAIYLDSAVLDIRSWPGRDRRSREWTECLEALGLTEDTVGSYRGNPLDRAGTVAAAKIPIIAVCGEADQRVPVAENTGALEKRYRELGAPIEVIVKPGAGHEPYGLPDPAPVVDFILRSARL